MVTCVPNPYTTTYEAPKDVKRTVNPAANERLKNIIFWPDEFQLYAHVNRTRKIPEPIAKIMREDYHSNSLTTINPNEAAELKNKYRWMKPVVDADGNLKITKDGKEVWMTKDKKEIEIDWANDDLWKSKTTTILERLWRRFHLLPSQNRAGATIKPIWWNYAMDYLDDFVRYKLNLPETTVGAIVEGFDIYYHVTDGSFYSWQWPRIPEMKSLLGLILNAWTNKRQVIDFFHPHFQRVLNNKKSMESFLGVELIWEKDGWFWTRPMRQIAEQIARYMGENRGAILTVFDLIPENEQARLSKIEISRKTKDGEETVKLNRDLFERISFNEGYHLLEEYSDMFTSSPWKKVKDRIKVRIFSDFFWWIDYHYGKFIAPALYSIAMSFGTGARELMALTSMNSAMYLTHGKVNAEFTEIKGDWGKFIRDNYKFGNSDELYDFLDWDATTIGNRMSHIKADVSNILWAGIYNVADVLQKHGAYAKRYSMFFKAEFPAAKSVEEIQHMLNLLDEGQRIILLEKAFSYVEDAVRWEFTTTLDPSKIKRVYVADDPFYQYIYSLYMRTYDFMKWWARAKRKWAVKQFQNAKYVYWTDIWKQYLNALTDPNLSAAEAADIRRSLTLNNRDLLNFIATTEYAFVIAKLTERAEEKRIWEEDLSGLDQLLRVFQIMSQFNWTYQAFSLLPEVQMLEKFFTTAINDYDANWTQEVRLDIAAWETWLKFFKNFTRAWWLTKGLVKAGSERGEIPENATPEEKFKKLFKALISSATAYWYYLNYELENDLGYKEDLWVSVNTFIYDLLGLPAKTIADQRELEARYKLINNYSDWESFTNHVLNVFPFSAEYRQGKFQDKTWAKEMLDEMFNSPEYYKFVHGEMPNFSDKTYAYAFRVAQKIWTTKYDRVNLDDLSVDRSFFTEDENKRINKGRVVDQEAIIHYLMKKNIDPAALDKITALYKKSDTQTKKEALRTLAYMEANAPWSSSVALAYLMEVEYRDRVWKKYPYWKSDLMPEAEANKIRADVARKYINYFYIADKNRVWNQAFLKGMSESKYKIADHIIWGDDDTAKQVAISLDKFWEKGDSAIYRNFQMQANIAMMAAQGDIDAYKAHNLFSNVIKPHKNHFNEDWEIKPERAKIALNYAWQAMDLIDSYGIPDSQKQAMKAWILMSSDKYLPYAVKSSKLNGQQSEVIQKVLHHLYGTINEMNDFAQEVAEEKFEWTYWKKDWNTTRYKDRKTFEKNRYDGKNIRSYLNKMNYKYLQSKNFNYQNKPYDKLAYTQDQWEKLKLKGQSRQEVFWMPRQQNKPSSSGWRSKDKAGGWISRKVGYARPPGAKTENPDKPFEYAEKWRVKRVRKSVAKPKDLAQLRRRVNKLSGGKWLSRSSVRRRKRTSKGKGRTSQQRNNT